MASSSSAPPKKDDPKTSGPAPMTETKKSDAKTPNSSAFMTATMKAADPITLQNKDKKIAEMNASIIQFLKDNPQADEYDPNSSISKEKKRLMADLSNQFRDGKITESDAQKLYAEKLQKIREEFIFTPLKKQGVERIDYNLVDPDLKVAFSGRVGKRDTNEDSNCAKRLPDAFKQLTEENRKKVMEQTYKNLNEKLRATNSTLPGKSLAQVAGSTSCLTVRCGNQVYTANVGDGVAFKVVLDAKNTILDFQRLNRVRHEVGLLNKKYLLLNREEKEEQARLAVLHQEYKEHAVKIQYFRNHPTMHFKIPIFSYDETNKYVKYMNHVACSRSIGDEQKKEEELPGTLHEPEAVYSDLLLDTKTHPTAVKTIILNGCDGLVEQMSEEKLKEEIQRYYHDTEGPTYNGLVKFLVDKGLEYGSGDNISLLGSEYLKDSNNPDLFMLENDGHGGHVVAQFISKELPTIFEKTCQLVLEQQLEKQKELAEEKDILYRVMNHNRLNDIFEKELIDSKSFSSIGTTIRKTILDLAKENRDSKQTNKKEFNNNEIICMALLSILLENFHSLEKKHVKNSPNKKLILESLAKIDRLLKEYNPKQNPELPAEYILLTSLSLIKTCLNTIKKPEGITDALVDGVLKESHSKLTALANKQNHIFSMKFLIKEIIFKPTLPSWAEQELKEFSAEDFGLEKMTETERSGIAATHTKWQKIICSLYVKNSETKQPLDKASERAIALCLVKNFFPECKDRSELLTHAKKIIAPPPPKQALTPSPAATPKPFKS